MSNELEIYKGNSKYLGVFPLDSTGENPYLLGDNDKVIFSVKGLLKTYIRKVFTKRDQNAETGEILVRILPEETLAMPPGPYTYDCLYVFANEPDDAYTFIGPAKLMIIDTVSKIGDGNG